MQPIQQCDIEDIPPTTRIQPLRPKHPQPSLSFEELEALGSHRIWEPVLAVPKDGPDDVEPQIKLLDQYSGF